MAETGCPNRGDLCADLYRARGPGGGAPENGKIKQDVAINLEERYYKKALSLENDLAIRAQMNRASREFYLPNSQR